MVEGFPLGGCTQLAFPEGHPCVPRTHGMGSSCGQERICMLVTECRTLDPLTNRAVGRSACREHALYRECGMRTICAALIGIALIASAAPAQARWVWYGDQWLWVQDQPVAASPWAYYMAEPWAEHHRHHARWEHEHERWDHDRR